MHFFCMSLKNIFPLLLAHWDLFEVSYWIIPLSRETFLGKTPSGGFWLDLFHSLHFWSMPDIQLWPIVNKYIVIYQILAFYIFGERLDIYLCLKTNCSLLMVEALGAHVRDFEHPTQSLLKFWVNCLFSFFITSAVKVCNFSVRFFIVLLFMRSSVILRLR